MQPSLCTTSSKTLQPLRNSINLDPVPLHAETQVTTRVTDYPRHSRQYTFSIQLEPVPLHAETQVTTRVTDYPS
jgi:hypothetical protein